MDIDNIPIGTIFETQTYQHYLPEWYLHMRGQLLKVAEYPELFKKIGWNYTNRNDAQDVFRLPPSTNHARFYIIKVKEAIDDQD